MYRIPYVPESVATHTRVLVGDLEHYFVNNGRPPMSVEPAGTRRLVASAEIGDVSPEAARRALELVARWFPAGSYRLWWHNCATYAFMLTAAMFDEARVAERFPRACNVVMGATLGWDFVDTVARAGGVDVLADGRAADPRRAALACAADPAALGRVLELPECGDRLRRDGELRRRAALVPGAGDVWWGFAWRGLKDALRRRELLEVIVDRAVPGDSYF